MGISSIQPAARLAACALMLAAMLGAVDMAAAQAAPDVRAAREREALRRSQQALRAAQEQQAALERDKAALGSEKARLDAALKRSAAAASGAQVQARRLRDDVTRLEAEAARLQADLVAAQAAAARELAALQARNDELASQLAQARQLLAERTATVGSVSALLARSVQALDSAEQKNRELYAIGLKLMDQYRNKSVADTLAQREPFLGLRAVELENAAEELRAQIETQRIVSPLVSASPGVGAPR